MKAIRLKTEYLCNPIGVDFTRPRLMWNCQGGIKQTAYRITAVSSLNTSWDSGEIDGDSMYAVYPEELHSRERITWNVTLRDERGEWGEPSDDAYFEMGLLSASDWRADWICGDYRVTKKYRYPTDHFRKIFDTEEIASARLYITACGVYEARLNGKRIGNYVLAPGHTEYRKRIQYQTYDITEFVSKGENIFDIELADGWYRGALGAWGHTYIYGKQTKVKAQLELTDTAGKAVTICTDESFSWCNDGSRLFADLKEGEVVNASKEPSFSGKARLTDVRAGITASNNYPITKHESFIPKLIVTPSGKKVLDFGQNISGFVGFSLNAKKGQMLRLRMGEMLDKNGEFTQDNIQLAMKRSPENMTYPRRDKKGRILNVGQFEKGKTTPLQMLEYICREGLNEYETAFALYGFRYALVEGDMDIRAEDFRSVAVYSDFEETGSFECSNPLINRFVKCTLWSEKSNSADVPTDCPTRERSGWTGDSQVFFDTASYLTAYAPFARKHIRDITDRQSKNGKFHQIAPKGGEDFWMATMNGSVGWADAGVLIPYRMWKKYGDTRILEDNFDAMDRYARFMIKRTGSFSVLARPVKLSKKNKKYLVNKGQSYGEWAEPDDVRPFAISDFVNPHPEESTAYTCYVMRCMSEIAELLGRSDRAELYRKYEEGCKRAYEELVTLNAFSLDTDRQAKLVRPLYLGLLNDGQRKFAEERLISALENYGWRLGTGFLSTPFILYVLTEISTEYAYRLLENEKCPGWLFMPKNDATTVWEAWEGNSTESRGIASLNHYSKGAVCSWLFDTCAGIRVGDKPNSFIVKAVPGGSLTYARASYMSIYGRIMCGWEKTDGGTVFNVSIPPNTEAEVILPSGKAVKVTAGEYIFTEEC